MADINENSLLAVNNNKFNNFSCKIHLEEASFLYEQCLTFFDDPEITWIDIDDFEERFEAHIDGLVVGEDLALEVCKQQATEGDFGELHAGVRVFCRQNRKDLVLDILGQLDPEDAMRLKAASDALKYELPDEWQNEFIQLLLGEDPKLVSMMSEVAGYRRMPAGNELLQAIRKSKPDSLPSIIRALGRLREKGAGTLLPEYLEHDDETVRSETALALLRIGDSQTINRCLRSAVSKNGQLLPLGLGGDRSAVPVLQKVVSEDGATPEGIIALGILGDRSALDILLSKLSDKNLAESAAMALNLITGADLYEEVFVPEVIEEDELFGEELEDFRQGKVPVRPDGKPYGTTITRITQKPDDWRNWLRENGVRFKPHIRYRNGKPSSPVCLLENLESEKSPNKVRRLAYEEMVIRYGIDIPFETDMPVAQQKMVLAQFANWVHAKGSLFQEGTWYFAGNRMS